MGKRKNNKEQNNKKLSKEEIIEQIENLPEGQIFNSDDFMEFLMEVFKTSQEDEEILGRVESLKKVRKELKDLLIKDVGKVLLKLKDIVHPDAPNYNDIIALIIRHNSFREMKIKGLMSVEAAGIEHRTIINVTLMIIESLEVEDME